MVSSATDTTPTGPVSVLIIAVPETAGSALYGMIDVLSAAGSIWQVLVHDDQTSRCFDVRILSPEAAAFVCGNGIPVQPACTPEDDPEARIVILPEMWLGPDEHLHGRYPALMAWLCEQYKRGTSIYSACSGAIMLAESGLLDGCAATSHWGYQDLFRTAYPRVRFNPEPNLLFADTVGRLVTAGGTTSWHDLALHIISRYASPGEALRIAKVYLLKWHGEGDLPYASLVRNAPHADSVVRKCEDWLKENYSLTDVVNRTVAHSGIPERSIKRRFKRSTGMSLIEYIQNLRIEEAKRLLEQTDRPVDEIGFDVSYADTSFFRRLFKRLTGLTPSQYRRLFAPILALEPEAANRVRQGL